MEIDFAFVCDAAEASEATINARGIGFDEIYAPYVPWTAEFWYVAQLNAHRNEVGSKVLHIELIDADGGVIAAMDDTFPVISPRPGEDTKARIAIAFAGVSFPQYGAYSLHFFADHHEMHVVPLTVRAPATNE